MIAGEIGCSFHEAQSRVTATEFLKYKQFFFQRANTGDYITAYLRSIAVEVRRTATKNPDTVKQEHLTLKFQKQKARPQLSPEDQLAQSKAGWFGMLGIKPDDV